MFSVVTRNRRHHTKNKRHKQKLHLSKLVIQWKQDSTRKRLEIIYRSHMLSLLGNRILCGKLSIINSQHPHWITITTGGTHHDPNHKVGTNHQYHSPQTGSSCTHAQSSVPSKTKYLSKTYNPVMHERNSGHTQMEDTKTTITTQSFKHYLFILLHEKSLVNIISFAAVASKFRITIDTEFDAYINVNLHGGKRIIFNSCGWSLYFFDTTIKAFTKDQTTDYTLLNNKNINKSCFHRQ